jgi:hypothetical protein
VHERSLERAVDQVAAMAFHRDEPSAEDPLPQRDATIVRDM